jgi:uncharacterized SAM-binding protein YcdF (DUF218 family)
VPEESVLTLPGGVTTTHAEVLAIREMAEAHCWGSLLIVTDPFHARRSRWIFRDVFDGMSVIVSVRPVEDYRYRAEDWW